MSHELRLESLKALAEIHKCDFKSTSSNSRVTSSNPGVVSSNPLVQESFNQ